MKRYISALASAAAVASLFVPLSAFAATINVPGDQPTIQAAVDAATAGDTINVAAGTYAEHVAVNKSLTLTGANAGTAGNAVRVAESIVDGTDTGTPFAITANDVTINGFTVMNGSNGGLFSGIWSQTGTQNSSIINNIIAQNGFGVWAQCAGNCSIANNLFDGNNKPDPGSSGISADSTNGLTVSNNEFKNHTVGNPILFQATAAGAHKNLTVSNNSFHDNTFTNVYSIGLDGAVLTGNTVAPASDATGFSFSGADANVTVTKNIISNSARGIRVEDAGFGLGANSAIAINRNSLTGNTEYGVGNITASTTLVDATCNWWGAANGPGPVGTGSGDKVTSNVGFANWLTTSDLNGECNGTASTTATLSAEDFGVVSFDTGLGTLRGYTAGFGLSGATFAGAQSVVMQLFASTTLLQTNTSTSKVGTDVTGTQISSPFDVTGNFNYVADGFWTNVRQSEFGKNVAANRVVATVTLADGTVLTAENTNLTGDPTTINASTLTSVTVAPATSTIAVKEKEDNNDNDHGGKDGRGGDKSGKDGKNKGKGNNNNGVANTVQLTATDFDQNGAVFVGATTTFSSSDPTVATVDSATGLVTAVKNGTTTITATSVSGTVTVSGTAVVNVVKKDNNDNNDENDNEHNDGHNGKDGNDNKGHSDNSGKNGGSNSGDSKGHGSSSGGGSKKGGH